MVIAPVWSDKLGLKQKKNFCSYKRIPQGSKTIFPMKNFSLNRTKKLNVHHV